MKLEDLTPETALRGIMPNAAVTVVSVQWHGSDALTMVYRDPEGRVSEEILYRHDAARLEIVEQGRPWSFDGDGALFRLVAEAHRIRLAHLFDPVLAVHTSLVEPLASGSTTSHRSANTVPGALTRDVVGHATRPPQRPFFRALARVAVSHRCARDGSLRGPRHAPTPAHR